MLRAGVPPLTTHALNDLRHFTAFPERRHEHVHVLVTYAGNYSQGTLAALRSASGELAEKRPRCACGRRALMKDKHWREEVTNNRNEKNRWHQDKKQQTAEKPEQN